ncbi:late embryogenesis abundant protein At1g64065-like [Sesamum indicum]|uniref:Late embryogenesis abundant protein At1g64065-like n=1 Tax=Sesamum indicum TaxID=4182 RepID=A0A6I9T1Y7_SESIN|nr:late embryogenesis abundant protein At1g64065-like [Sesamum indicum]
MSTGEGRRSSKKCLAYVAAFVVFQTAIILLFVLIVMKVRSPKVRINAMEFESFSSTTNNSTSFNMSMLAQVTIKNNNFGDFKYENSTLSFLYNGIKVGEAVVPRGRAGARKTKKFNFSVDLSGIRDRVGNDMNSGVLRLSSRGKVSGKVHLIKVIKRNKSGEMKCDWSINLATRQFEDLKCI